MVTPVLAAADAAALRVDCALNTLVSIPALSNKDLSHLACVGEFTNLWAKPCIARKTRKKNSALCLPLLDYFARSARNTIPSGVYPQYQISSILRSADLHGLVKTRIIIMVLYTTALDRQQNNILIVHNKELLLQQFLLY